MRASPRALHFSRCRLATSTTLPPTFYYLPTRAPLPAAKHIPTNTGWPSRCVRYYRPTYLAALAYPHRCLPPLPCLACLPYARNGRLYLRA